MRHEDPEDDEEECLGQALQGFIPLLRVPREDERDNGGERHHHGEAVRVAHLVEEALEDLAASRWLKFQSEDVLELGRADDDGGGGRETGEHRMRQKPRDELEAEETHARLKDADEERERGREAGTGRVLGGILQRDKPAVVSSATIATGPTAS